MVLKGIVHDMEMTQSCTELVGYIISEAEILYAP